MPGRCKYLDRSDYSSIAPHLLVHQLDLETSYTNLKHNLKRNLDLNLKLNLYISSLSHHEPEDR